MQCFANRTNLSETTLLLPPTHLDADDLVQERTAGLVHHCERIAR
ncbi:UNVERIFIED_ORG: putative PhzF superfamily epimerase YddE/YHI9 [Arthrobacter sp. UYEF1]